MLNKREVSEIKKQYRPESCSITRICGCYVGAEKDIKMDTNEAFLSLPEEDAFKFFEIFRNGLSGKIGRDLLNLEFPREAEEMDGAQEFLRRIRNSKLKDNDLLNDFYEMVIDAYDYAGNYLILLIHNIYDIPGKATDGITMEDASDEVYEYIQCCICPVELSKPGLGYNEKTNIFEHCTRNWVVGMPEISFLFPAFNNRSTDIHSVLLYEKKDFQFKFIEEVLGCRPPLNAETQRAVFYELIEKTLDVECTCEIVSEIFRNLQELLEESKNLQEALELDRPIARRLFEDSAANENSFEKFNELYNKLIGDNKLLASNLVDEKTFKIELPGTAIKLNPDYISDTEVRMVNGRKCLVIGISGEIEVNGVKCEK